VPRLKINTLQTRQVYIALVAFFGQKRGISGENGEILGYFEGPSLVFLFHDLLNYIIRKQID
jgi:hypothetical protein